MTNIERGQEALDALKMHREGSDVPTRFESGSKHPYTRPKRDPPAFQCYASDWMANEEYMDAGLAERGLLLSLLNYCWVNGSIPKDRAKIAQRLGISESEVKEGWGQLISSSFVDSPDDQGRLHCPELARQKTEKNEYREQQANRGRLGGLTTQSNLRSQR